MIRFIPFLLLILGACANIVPPSGGPIDQTAPKLILSSPTNLQTSFIQNKIVLQYDELVHLTNREKIQIFPGKINPKKTTSKGKNIILEFDSLPNGTVLLSWNSAIRDVNNDNISSVQSLIFSTNSVLDSSAISLSFCDILNRKQTGPFHGFLSDEKGLIYRQFDVIQSDTIKFDHLPLKEQWFLELGLPNKKDSIIAHFVLREPFHNIPVGLPLGIEKPFGFDSLRTNEIQINNFQSDYKLYEVRDQQWYSVNKEKEHYFICSGSSLLVLISPEKSALFYSLEDNKKINQINWNEFSSTPSIKRK